MLLSDRDIRAEIEAGRVVLDPLDLSMVQPSSVDVRLDRFFRLFDNHKYAVIDPSQDQPDLTRLVEAAAGDPFVLHPGEFVLGSTYESVTLPDDHAARLEGKALALDTRVPTPDGWTTMGALDVGCEVFDEHGIPCRVVAVTPPMLDRPCREVLLSDGSTFVADAAHQWVTTTKADRRPGRSRAPAVRTTDQIAATLTVRGEYNHQLQLAGAAQYPERELPIDPHVLGTWLGDGTSTSAQVTVGVGDEQVLEEIERAGHAVRPSGVRSFCVGGPMGCSSERRRDRSGRWAADESLNSRLRALGLLGNEHVPQEYLISSMAQRLALLQGLMDSDGHVDVYGRCEFVNTRENLADAVFELAASLGLRPSRRKERATLNGVDCGPAYRVEFTPRFPVFRLERELARSRTDDRAHAHRSVRAVRVVPSVPVRCIQVSAPSGMFLIGEAYVPTHNSSLGRLGLLTHSTAGFIDPGFSGHVTLELSNVATLPITLWPGMKIGQLCFFRLSSPAEHAYGSARHGSRYQGQRGPTASRSHLSFHRTDVG